MCRLPHGSYSFNDVATDDAVSNNPDNPFRLMATGNWSSINNPMDRWTGAFAAIQYLNIILEEASQGELGNLRTIHQRNVQRQGNGRSLWAPGFVHVLFAAGARRLGHQTINCWACPFSRSHSTLVLISGRHAIHLKNAFN